MTPADLDEGFLVFGRGARLSSHLEVALGELAFVGRDRVHAPPAPLGELGAVLDLPLRVSACPSRRLSYESVAGLGSWGGGVGAVR